MRKKTGPENLSVLYFFQFDTCVIVANDFFAVVPLQGHPVGPILTHPDCMTLPGRSKHNIVTVKVPL